MRTLAFVALFLVVSATPNSSCAKKSIGFGGFRPPAVTADTEVENFHV